MAGVVNNGLTLLPATGYSGYSAIGLDQTGARYEPTTHSVRSWRTITGTGSDLSSAQAGPLVVWDYGGDDPPFSWQFHELRQVPQPGLTISPWRTVELGVSRPPLLTP